jgi:hypothetical protein
MPFPSTLRQWLADQAIPLAALIFALMMGLCLLYLSVASRRAAVARRRVGRSEDTFVDELATYGYDPEIARLTYITLRDRHQVPFPILPTDDLERDLGVQPEELDQLLQLLLDATGRRRSPGMLSAPIATVAHVVRHVQSSPLKPQNRRRSLHIA